MKKLYITEKQWTSPAEFVKIFPFAKLPLIMLWIDSQTKVTEQSDGKAVMTIFSRSNALRSDTPTITDAYLGYSKWEYDKKISAYRDIVRYAIGPDYPLTITFEPTPMSVNLNPDAIRMLAYEYITDKQKLGADRLDREGVGGNSKPRQNYAKLLTQKQTIINTLFTQIFKRFQVNTQSEWREFAEGYADKLYSVEQVPANTIAYTVSGLGPPLKGATEADWKKPEFWSKVFAYPMGMAILNAVTSNFPVSVKTLVTDWKDTNHPYIKEVKSDASTMHYYQWVFQDFVISIGTKGNILVNYNRGIGNAEYEEMKASAWDTFAPIAMLLIVVAIAFAPMILAALATTAPGAGATGATIAASTGSGLTAGGGVVASSSVIGGGVTAVGGVTTGSTLTFGSVVEGISTVSSLVSTVSSAAGGSKGGGKVGAIAGGISAVTGGYTNYASATDNISKVAAVAKPVAGAYMTVQGQKQAKLRADAVEKQNARALKTVRGVNKYQPVTGVVPTSTQNQIPSHAIQTDNKPILVTIGGLLLTFLMSKG